MARSRAHTFAAFDVEPDVVIRCCDQPGCEQGGEFRAPKARDKLNDYYWFCLEHVREYNKAWDFYRGMDTAEIEAHMRQDTTWGRPSWPLGKRSTTGYKGRPEPRFHDPFNVFDGAPPGATTHGSAESAREPARPRPGSPEAKALVLFEAEGEPLEMPLTMATLKTRYKELAKRHHPDANGGDKAAEERLKSINEAYATLRASLSASP